MIDPESFGIRSVEAGETGAIAMAKNNGVKQQIGGTQAKRPSGDVVDRGNLTDPQMATHSTTQA